MVFPSTAFPLVHSAITTRLDAMSPPTWLPLRNTATPPSRTGPYQMRRGPCLDNPFRSTSPIKVSQTQRGFTEAGSLGIMQHPMGAFVPALICCDSEYAKPSRLLQPRFLRQLPSLKRLNASSPWTADVRRQLTWQLALLLPLFSPDFFHFHFVDALMLMCKRCIST